jgi:hypothetical protein
MNPWKIRNKEVYHCLGTRATSAKNRKERKGRELRQSKSGRGEGLERVKLARI